MLGYRRILKDTSNASFLLYNYVAQKQALDELDQYMVEMGMINLT